jgi:hypothetical protein
MVSVDGPEYTALSDRMIRELWIGKVVKGSRHGLI